MQVEEIKNFSASCIPDSLNLGNSNIGSARTLIFPASTKIRDRRIAIINSLPHIYSAATTKAKVDHGSCSPKGAPISGKVKRRERGLFREGG